ncbi:MAG: hypothetical protein J0M29_05230 [Chitinophagales bacterium]|nr:hypothetical protein [Chitinophagales bacterium]
MKKLSILLLTLVQSMTIMAQQDTMARKGTWSFGLGINVNRSMRFGLIEDDQIPGPGFSLGADYFKPIHKTWELRLSGRYAYLFFAENVYTTSTVDLGGGIFSTMPETSYAHYERHAVSFTAGFRKTAKRNSRRFWIGEIGSTYMSRSRLADNFLTLGVGAGWSFRNQKTGRIWLLQPMFRGYFWGASNPHDAHLMLGVELMSR